MLLGDRGTRCRCLLVWMSGTSSLALVALLLRPGASRAWASASRGTLSGLPLDRAMVELAAYVLLACLAWSWLALTATVVEAWSGVGTARRRAWQPPDVVRRVVLAACGVAIATGAAAPSVASDGATTHRHLHGVALLDGLPLPDRAVAPSGRAAPSTAPPPARRRSEHTRRRPPRRLALVDRRGRPAARCPRPRRGLALARDLRRQPRPGRPRSRPARARAAPPPLNRWDPP